MAKTYVAIQQQIEELKRQAEALKRQEVAGVVAQIRKAIDTYGLTRSDLFDAPGKAKKAEPKPAPKTGRKAAKAKPGTVRFRDDAGNTWSGRGKRPEWFKSALAAGKTAEELRAK